jgi:L-aspartate oxidase
LNRSLGTAGSQGAYDVIIIGSGIAGLCAALTAAPRARVALLTKGELEDGCSRWAQGGIAAAIGGDDSAQRHFDDTMQAGRGLCNADAVRILVDEAPERIRQLTEWGVVFDTQDGELLMGREAAHSRSRIVHARGDGTGLEIETALIRRVRASTVDVIEHAHVTRLLVDDSGRCSGVVVVDGVDHTARELLARAVILASGGAARLWRNTTNPPSATGDGVALAYEAGADIAGMEFVQFHPTALALDRAPSFLISEAVRGEGAVIVNEQGKRFVQSGDAAGELAGRDVVARAIWDELRATGASHVYLDCRPLGSRAKIRFPGVHRTCLDYGIDMTRDLIPIAPAAHYTIGGVRTDVRAATSVAGLYACGEVASSGVHGANRLASNSLLESVVFGRRAADAALVDTGEAPPPPSSDPAIRRVPRESHDRDPQWRAIEDALWEGAGVIRDAAGLRQAREVTAAVADQCAGDESLAANRLRAAATTASLVCAAALAREESRGCHVRLDFPDSAGHWHGSLVMHQDEGAHLDPHI